MEKGNEKIFIIDTNVILHDSSCITKFKQYDIIIPITVLEELDKFKKGHDTLNYHAREFLRKLDSLSGDKIFEVGAKISPELGKIFIRLDQKLHSDLQFNFASASSDHRILNTAYCLSKENPEKLVVLVTKDVNLRMKAKAIGLMARDYTGDHVKDISKIYAGYRLEENVSQEIINVLYQRPYEIEASQVNFTKELLPNEFLIMRNGKQSVLARYDPFKMKIRRVDKIFAHGIAPRNAEQTFALSALMNSQIQLVTVTGKAGTGKTLLALAAALENKKNYRQLYMARPVVPLSNKDMGFLPGDVEEKLDPYMQPLFDNLGVIRNKYLESSSKLPETKNLLEQENLIIAPLAYIRGRSLVNIYFIVDEAQNLTPHEVKTIITRAGEGTKLVFTGDIFQIDHPYLDTYSNGLSYLIEKMQGQKIYTHINLEKGERSLLADIASELL
ncbi:MAG: PhoH family protein [Candidatus Omnitrophica bacterium]|nr:PhoH family protein [Candidatus Omnitrophota bacterium]